LVQGTYDFLDKIWEKINIGSPIATTVTYIYPKSQMKTTRLYHLPVRRRQIQRTKIELPRGHNFKILNIWDIDSGIDCTNTVVRDEEDRIIIDPSNLPSDSEKLMIVTLNDVDQRFLKALVDVRVSEVSSKEDENNEKHWIVAAIKDEKLLIELYRHATLEDVDVAVGINVDRHYSTVLRTVDNPLLELMRANQDIFKGIDSDRRSLQRTGEERRRRILRQSMKPTKEDLFSVLTALCMPQMFKNYILLDNPNFQYIDARRSESLMTLGNIMLPIPSGMNVTVYTTLKLDDPAQKGNLIFNRGDFRKDIERILRRHFK